jgi:putative ABC transport system substrate-binding protein
MKRREFITLLGGAATAWPLAAYAQSAEHLPRVGVLMGLAENDPASKARLAAFREGLERLGWSDGRSVQIDYRYAPANSVEQARVLARELIALRPNVILANSPSNVAAVQRETQAIPIVFIGVSDPIGGGFIKSLARPGANITGLMNYEPGITGKWLAMLKEIAPRLTRAGLVGNPKTTAFDYYLNAAEVAATSLAIELVPYRVETIDDIERDIDAFARVSNGGLLFPPDSTIILHRDRIIGLAARHRLPTVFPYRFFVVAGGLICYGTDLVDQYRQVASHIDRILRGANPADLPVQTPTKFETVINLKTAKTLGLTVPTALLVAANEVIE